MVDAFVIFCLLAGTFLVWTVIALVLRKSLFTYLYPALVQDLLALRRAHPNPPHQTTMRIDHESARAAVQAATGILQGVPSLRASVKNLQTIAADLSEQLAAAQAANGNTDALTASLTAAQATIAALDASDAALDADILALKAASDALSEAVAPEEVLEETLEEDEPYAAPVETPADAPTDNPTGDWSSEDAPETPVEGGEGTAN